MEKIKETDELDLFAGLLTSAQIALNIFDRGMGHCLYRNSTARGMFPETDGAFPPEYVRRVPTTLQEHVNVTFNLYCDIEYGDRRIIGCEVSATAGQWHDTDVIAVTLRDVTDAMRHSADLLVEKVVERVCREKYDRVFLLQTPSGHLYDISNAERGLGRDYEREIVSEVSYKTAETDLNGLVGALSLEQVTKGTANGEYCVSFKSYGKQGAVLQKRACFTSLGRENGIILGTIDDVTEESIQETKVSELTSRASELAKELSRRDICMKFLDREIRVPLNTILGLSRLSVARAREVDAMLAEDFEKIHLSSQDIRETAEDIARLVRDGARSDARRLTSIGVRELAHGAAAAAHGFIQARHIRFTCDTSQAEVEIVNLPEEETKRCLIRMLEDALQLVPEAGECGLTLREDISDDSSAMDLIFEIRLPGAEMDEERLAALRSFDEGNEPDARSMRLVGTCLGIAYSFAHAIGGSLRVGREDGAIVYLLRVPVRAASLSAGAKPGVHRKEYLSAGRVLLTEGRQFNLEVEKRMLENIGLTVVCARTCQEALERFSAEGGRFQAIFLDMRLPGMDSIACAHRIRDMAAIGGDRVPIVAVTDDAYEEDLVEVREVGIDACLVKPMDVDAIYGVLSQLHAGGEKS